jgi:hypothetical protein
VAWSGLDKPNKSRSTLSKVNAKRHKIIDLPATPKSYKGDSFALCQGHYYVGNHKVHIALQNEAWGKARDRTLFSNPRINMKFTAGKKHADKNKEALEVLPQAAQSQNLQALIARMACIRPCGWLALDLLTVLIQSP